MEVLPHRGWADDTTSLCHINPHISLLTRVLCGIPLELGDRAYIIPTCFGHTAHSRINIDCFLSCYNSYQWSGVFFFYSLSFSCMSVWVMCLFSLDALPDPANIKNLRASKYLVMCAIY